MKEESNTLPAESPANPEPSPVQYPAPEFTKRGLAARVDALSREAPGVVSEAENSKPDETQEDVHRPVKNRWFAVTLFIQLFKLSAKFVPIAGVLVGGYYGYAYFFGPVPVVEKAAMELGLQDDELMENSKVGQMLQQTRDAVAASDARVLAANALADGAVGDLFDSAKSVVAKTTQEVRELTAEKSATVSVLEQFASFEAERSVAKSEQSSTYSFQQPIDPEPEVDSEVEASGDFREWVQQARIGGVRKGSIPKVFINGLTLKVGSKADHSLGITFEGLTEDGQALVFRDNTNATLIKPY